MSPRHSDNVGHGNGALHPSVALEQRHQPPTHPEELMRLFAPTITVAAHCDLPCGVYDPAQARIEAQSVKACMEKYHASDDA